MKSKDFTLFYKFFANMYGAIYSDDAYLIMKIFFPSLLKKEMYKDMKSRVYLDTKGYTVYKTVDNKYVITRPSFDFDDLDQLFELQGNKPFFVPENLLGVEYYTNRDFFFDKNDDDLESFYYFLTFRLKTKKVLQPAVYNIYKRFDILFDSIDTPKFSKFMDILYEYKFECIEEDDINTLMRVYTNLNNNTKTITNRGYSPKELKELVVPETTNEVVITPDMRKRFLNNPGEAEKFLKKIRVSDLSMIEKQSLIDEINQIIEQRDFKKS